MNIRHKIVGCIFSSPPKDKPLSGWTLIKKGEHTDGRYWINMKHIGYAHTWTGKELKRMLSSFGNWERVT